MRYNHETMKFMEGSISIIRPMTASDCRSIDQAFLAQQWPSRQATLERYLQKNGAADCDRSLSRKTRDRLQAMRH